MIEAPRIFPSGKALSQTGGHGDFRARSDQLEPAPAISASPTSRAWSTASMTCGAPRATS